MSRITFPHVVTLGPAGTFSDEAAHMVMDAQSRIEYKRTFPETLGQVEENPGQVAVVPIENSVAGIVEQVQDMLVAKDLFIVGELNIHVRFALLANVPIEDVRTFYAHPQTNGQTLNYSDQHLRQAVVEYTNSNVESGVEFLQSVKRGEPAASIVPISYAERHPQYVQAVDIQDYTNNTTRFLVVRRRMPAYMRDLSGEKTSIMVEFKEDRSGLLYELLSIFKKHDINLCRLESRPSKVTPWFYVFYVDFTNNENTASCMEDLTNSPFHCTFLGSYSLLS